MTKKTRIHLQIIIIQTPNSEMDLDEEEEDSDVEEKCPSSMGKQPVRKLVLNSKHCESLREMALYSVLEHLEPLLPS